MRFLSVCSGIEAASVAWNPLGWSAVAFSEIEPFPCSLLKHHYPDTPNWGDMNNFKDWPDVSIDLLCGGTPCQSFSVAGLRKGLDDPRGNLMLTFGAIASKYRPQWLVWENVPGVLSSNGGRDFGSFLGMLGQLGYGFAYRICDAQYHGVAQRRRRVFVVGCLGDWHSAAAVLFERHSLSGHPAPSREKGEEVAGVLTSRASGGGGGPGAGTDEAAAGYLQAVASTGSVPHCLNAGGMGRQDYETETLIPTTGAVFDVVDVAPTLRAGGNATGGTRPYGTDVDTCDSLIPVPFDASEDGTGRGTPLGPVAFAVRRLTVEECEFLQGFPRGYSKIPWRGKPADQCPDGPRYKALGNSWAVPCITWLGKRIQLVEDICINARRAA